MTRIERRGAKRLPVNLPLVVYGVNSQGRGLCEITSTINVSASGVFFSLNMPIEAFGDLEVSIIQSERNGMTRFRARGRVVRREPTARTELSGKRLPANNMAVQFIENLKHNSAA